MFTLSLEITLYISPDTGPGTGKLDNTMKVHKAFRLKHQHTCYDIIRHCKNLSTLSTLCTEELARINLERKTKAIITLLCM